MTYKALPFWLTAKLAINGNTNDTLSHELHKEVILWSHWGYKWKVMPKKNVILPNLTSKMQNPSNKPNPPPNFFKEKKEKQPDMQ